MTTLNNSFLLDIKSALNASKFSESDFTIDHPKDLLLQITFKYDPQFNFILQEKRENLTIESTANILGEKTTRRETTISTYAIYTPGEHKIKDNVDIGTLSYAVTKIKAWCTYLSDELAVKKTAIAEEAILQQAEQMRKHFQDSIDGAFTEKKSDENISDSELDAIKVKFAEIIGKFESLEAENKINKAQLDSVKRELEKLQNSAKTVPKGLWAKMTNNRLVDIFVSFAKSKEARELIAEFIKIAAKQAGGAAEPVKNSV